MDSSLALVRKPEEDETDAMSEGGSRKLATVLFTDMVGSTEIAAKLGDARWRELLRRHHAIIRAQLKRFDGREVDTAGDGVFAIFDVPARAVRCACAIAEATQELGVDIRAGLHVGEVEAARSEVRGIAVHTGSRVCAIAGPTDVFVTSTLTELVGGSGIEFEDRGVHTFKGVPGDWRVFNVTMVASAARPAPLDPATAEERLALIEPPRFVRRNRRFIAAGVAVVLVGIATTLALAPRSSPAPKPPPAPLDSVIEIDPASGALVRQGARDLPVDTSQPVRLTVGEGAVWLLTSGDLFQLDALSGQFRNSIPGVLAFGIGRGVIWIDNGSPVSGPGPKAATLASLDPSTGDVLTSNGAGHLLSASPRAVWVATTGGIAVVDPRTGRALKRFRLNGQASDGVAVPGAYWVADNTADTLTRIDLSSGIETTLPLAATPDRIVVGGGYVWALDRAGGTVTVIDAKTAEQIAAVRVSAHPTDMAYGAGAIWISDGQTGTITRIEAATTQVSTIRVGVPIVTLAMDTSTGDLWIAIAPSCGKRCG